MPSGPAARLLATTFTSVPSGAAESTRPPAARSRKKIRTSPAGGVDESARRSPPRIRRCIIGRFYACASVIGEEGRRTVPPVDTAPAEAYIGKSELIYLFNRR